MVALTEMEAFRSSLWSAVSPPAPDLPKLAGETKVDVCVVGAGFLGLSTALHLAEAGRTVALLEAEEPGYAASGRNMGFIVPDYLAFLDPAIMRGKLGAEHGDRLSRMLMGAGSLVFDIIRRHGIDCEAVQNGWIQPVHGAAKAAGGWLENRVGLWRALGRELITVGAEESRRLTGSPHYHGALIDPTGGHVVPLALARGLAAAVARAGGSVFARSPVHRVAPEGKGWRIEAGEGTVRADRVVFTTNVTSHGARPELDAVQVPIRIVHLATRPLDPALRQIILPENHCSSDSRRDLIAYRWAPGNRLVTGGTLAIPDPGMDRAVRWFLKRLTTMLPALDGVDLGPEFVWHGTAGMAPTLTPMIMQPEAGLLAVMSCNGRGIAMTTAMGREIARFLTSNAEDPASLPVPLTPPRPIPFPWMAKAAKMVLLPLARRKDYREGAPI